MKHISLTMGFVTLVDDEDHERLSKHKWRAQVDSTTGNVYACRHVAAGVMKQRTVMMHREILGLQYGDPRKGDHKFRVATLDNQRSNLRIVTAGESVLNRGLNKNNKSGFRGVCRARNSWVAQIIFKNKTQYIGSYKTPQEASIAYSYMAAHLFGEFAQIDPCPIAAPPTTEKEIEP